jgi:hypothetical protein
MSGSNASSWLGSTSTGDATNASRKKKKKNVKKKKKKKKNEKSLRAGGGASGGGPPLAFFRLGNLLLVVLADCDGSPSTTLGVGGNGALWSLKSKIIKSTHHILT